MSYRYFEDNREASLKIDFSVQISSSPERIPWKVRLTKLVKNLLTKSQVGDVAHDIARIIITWAKRKGHCHNGNTTSNLHISSSQYRLRSIHWAILVAYALQLSADLKNSSLPIQVRTVLRCISNISFTTHLLIVDTNDDPNMVWKPRQDETRCSAERTQFWIMHCHNANITDKNRAKKANCVGERGSQCLQTAALQASEQIMF